MNEPAQSEGGPLETLANSSAKGRTMAQTDVLYSQVVTWLKIVLPIAALGLLSTLFLFARAPAGENSIPFAEIESMAREQAISNPKFSGVADDGTVIAITATTARPDFQVHGTLDLENITANVESVDGIILRLMAGVGRINSVTRTAELSGLARLHSSNGYIMETSGLIADLNSGHIASLGPLEVQTPFGSLNAGHLEIETGKDGQGRQMVFNDGVTLIYLPQQ